MMYNKDVANAKQLQARKDQLGAPDDGTELKEGVQLKEDLEPQS